MIQPVELKDFLLTFFVSAGIILCGAGYALCFAWGRLRGQPRFLRWALLAYAGLALCVLTLTRTAHLDGAWATLTLMMLAGYYVAPRVIFRLCVDTHAAGQNPPPSTTNQEKTP